MNIVIVGQGAIGLLWYSQLTQNTTDEHQISLYQAKHHTNIGDSVFFTNIHQEKTKIKVIPCYEQDLSTADVILLCVKSYQVKQAYLDVINNLAPHVILIFCHNGMLDYKHLQAENTSLHPWLALLTSHGSLKSTHDAIIHTGMGRSDIGLVSGQLNIQTKAAIMSSLNSAMGCMFWHENIAIKQWTKLAINCAINPLTAIDNVENGEVGLPKYHDQIEKVVREVIAVASAENIHLDEQVIIQTVIDVANATAHNCSSMRRDILEKRKTEIDYINGFIIDKAVEHHINTPVNQSLLCKVKHMELNL